MAAGLNGNALQAVADQLAGKGQHPNVLDRRLWLTRFADRTLRRGRKVRG